MNYLPWDTDLKTTGTAFAFQVNQRIARCLSITPPPPIYTGFSPNGGLSQSVHDRRGDIHRFVSHEKRAVTPSPDAKTQPPLNSLRGSQRWLGTMVTGTGYRSCRSIAVTAHGVPCLLPRLGSRHERLLTDCPLGYAGESVLGRSENGLGGLSRLGGGRCRGLRGLGRLLCRRLGLVG